MNQIVNKNYFNFLTYTFFIIFAYLIVKTYGFTMLDDGWRHLGMALHPKEVVSWQRVFPHSLYTDFDPWFTWHKLLRFIGLFVEKESIPVIVNTFMYSALSFWYYLVFKRFSKLKLIYILIIAALLPLLHRRYFYLRPDLLSGLFLLYLIIIKNRFLIFMTSIVYAPFYYIFWFYLGYAGYVKLIVKDYKSTLILFIVGIIGLSFYFIYDFNGYINIMQNVLNNDILTQGHSVTESNPFIIPISIKDYFGSSPLLLLLMTFSLLIFYALKPKNEFLIYILLFAPLFFIQYRFRDLLQPLFFSYLVIIFHYIYKDIEKNGIDALIKKGLNFIKEKSYFGNISKPIFKMFIVISFIIYFLVTHVENIELYNQIQKEFKANSFLKDKQFHNKRILITNMGRTMYMGVLLNPTGEYIPNCSLGWVDYDEKNKNTYFKILRNKDTLTNSELFEFLKVNKVDYFIIDSTHSTNLILSQDNMLKNGFIFEKITNSKLIFKKVSIVIKNNY